MSCWGASPREIGGSRRLRGERGHERRGVDDIGEMGEWSRAGLQRGGSCHALGWKGSMSRIEPELERGRNEGGSPNKLN